MKWDDSGWYKWNESEMKYISQVKEPEEDMYVVNRVPEATPETDQIDDRNTLLLTL